MASDGARLYVSGGDWVTSATDGTWSVNATTFDDWRQDVPAPAYPTLPAPHALQDGAGFEWVAKRGKFLMWPGSYFPYPQPWDEVANPNQHYSYGMWWFDPKSRTYAQDNRLFGKWLATTGCPFGGVYDEANDHIVAFSDASGSCLRWDVAAGVKLPDLPLGLRRDPVLKGCYFARTKPVKIGRYVYVIGIRTDGNASSQVAFLFRWHLDAHACEELAPPPVKGALLKDKEVRPAAAHGKLVWPVTYGPEGDVDGIAVYDPAKNAWTVDRSAPKFGNFIGNAICSLPDERIAFCGGGFGKPQTHLWLIEAI